MMYKKNALILLGFIVILMLVLVNAATAAKIYDNTISSDMIIIEITDRDSIKHTITVQMDSAAKVTDIKKKTDEKDFKNVFTDVDTEYQISDYLIKEKIILKSDKAKTSYDFTIADASGLKYELDANGNLIFKTYEGDYTVITCPKPYALDATGIRYEYEFKLTGNKIKISPVDKIKNVTWPLTIDPSYVISSVTTSDSTHSHRNLVRTSDGNFYATYLKNISGNDTVCVAYSDDLTEWDEIKQFTGQYGDSMHPAMAIDHWDNLHVVWAGWYNDTRGDIFYSSFNGTAWSTVDRITSIVPEGVYPDPYVNMTATYPAIAIDSIDNLHIVFFYEYESGGVPNIVDAVGYMNYNGSVWSVITNLVGTTAVIESTPYETAICIDSNDNLHVTWAGVTDAEPNYHHIYYRKSTTGGASWNVVEQLTSDPFNHTQPSIGVDNQDQVLIAYAAYGNWSGRKIRLLEYNLTAWEEPINISDGFCDGYWQGNPSIIPYQDFIGTSPSDVSVVWWGYSACSPDSSSIFSRSRYIDSWDRDYYSIDCNSTNYHPQYTRILIEGNNATYPVGLFATFPEKCGTPTNIIDQAFVPYTSYIFPTFTYTLVDITKTLVEKGYSTFATYEGFDITITAYDIRTGASIMNFTAYLDTGSSGSTTSGIVSFECEDAYEWIEVTVNSQGYYASKQTTYLDSDKEITIVISPIGLEPNVLPEIRPITITVVSFLGTRYEMVNVSMTPIEHTYGSLDWLWSVFGVTESTDIPNSTMSGFTDADGDISFVIVDGVKYTVTCVKAAAGINKTIELYPKSGEHYTIYIWSSESELVVWHSFVTNVTINVTTETIDSTHAYINVSYTDDSGGTAVINYTINRSEISGMSNETTVASGYDAGGANINISEIVENYRGQMYYISLLINHSEFGEVPKTYSVKFRGIRLDLGFEDETVYVFFAICSMFLLGLIFGGTIPDYGALIVCFGGWMFYGFGWFDPVGYSAPLVLSMATVISILYIIIQRGHKEGYT
jgi:hypothetical protein